MRKFAFATLFLVTSPLAAAELPGPVEARVVRVVDGDTFEADALVWPGHMVRVKVRIRGIDAPELRARCASEKQAALAAQETLTGLLLGEGIQVRNVGADKYFGRVVADVETGDGSDVATRLLAMNVARPYDGGKRVPSCPSG